MSGIYGTVKPAVVNIQQDVDIFYNYKPNRGSSDASSSYFKKVDDVTTWFTEASLDGTSIIDGLYNLKLPLDVFGKKGIYTIYIKPKEYTLNITDIGTLGDFPDIRGVIFSTNELESHMTTNSSLIGYRIQYSGGETRIITSNNQCTYITGSQNKFSFNSGVGTGNKLMFCTVTPSSANSFTPSSAPFIGNAGDEVKLVNTKFNPIMFEIEMVDHDDETISYMLEGTQVRNLENGTFTTYNNEGGIYNQFETYTVKTQLGKPLYDVKSKKSVIDTSQSYDNVIG